MRLGYGASDLRGGVMVGAGMVGGTAWGARA